LSSFAGLFATRERSPSLPHAGRTISRDRLIVRSINSTAGNAPIARVMGVDAGASTSRGSGAINTSADSLVKSGNLMPPTPHNDLHPAARDHTQEEGRERSQSDLCVKHCHCPCERLVLLGGLQIRHRYGQKAFFTSISQTSFPLPCSIALAVPTAIPTTGSGDVAATSDD
jgi:hypothetical protein